MESGLVVLLGGLGFLLWQRDSSYGVNRDRKAGKKRNGVLIDSETNLPIYESQWPHGDEPEQRFFERAYTGDIEAPTEEARRLIKQPWFLEKLARLKHASKYRKLDNMQPEVRNTTNDPFTRSDFKRFPAPGMREVNEALADIPSILPYTRVLKKGIIEQKGSPIAE